jgi:hypothetical protein
MRHEHDDDAYFPGLGTALGASSPPYGSFAAAAPVVPLPERIRMSLAVVAPKRSGVTCRRRALDQGMAAATGCDTSMTMTPTFQVWGPLSALRLRDPRAGIPEDEERCPPPPCPVEPSDEEGKRTCTSTHAEQSSVIQNSHFERSRGLGQQAAGQICPHASRLFMPLQAL